MAGTRKIPTAIHTSVPRSHSLPSTVRAWVGQPWAHRRVSRLLPVVLMGLARFEGLSLPCLT